MPEDRTPRIVAPTEIVPSGDDSENGRPGAHTKSSSRTDEDGEEEWQGMNHESGLDRDTPVSGEAEDKHDRVHFPLFS